MSEFFGSVWWLLVTLGVLVTFHEFGHFWSRGAAASRCCASRSASASRCGRDVIATAPSSRSAAIPLGGYVKMLDAREAEVAPAELDQTFNRKPVGSAWRSRRRDQRST